MSSEQNTTTKRPFPTWAMAQCNIILAEALERNAATINDCRKVRFHLRGNELQVTIRFPLGWPMGDFQRWARRAKRPGE